MIKLLRLLQGYVVFEATNGFVERFLNLCKINNINLWNVKNDGVKVVAFTSANEFSNIFVPAQRSGMEIKALKKCGLPFFIKEHKWRFGAICGIVMVVLSLSILSCFVWEVEIVSTTGVKIEGFTEKVDELGVRTGAVKSHIDILQIQEELLDSFSELSWVSLNIFGTKAQIEYTCGNSQKPIADTNTPANIVAKKNGEIVLVEGYIGENMVKHGDMVAEGSLLISGVIKNADMSESLVHATGKVFARTVSTLSCESIQEKQNMVIQDAESVYRMIFFGLNIPLGLSSYDKLSDKTDIYLEGNNTVLPVGFERTDTACLTEQSIKLTNEECILQSLLRCVSKKREQFDNAELEAVEYSVDEVIGKTVVNVEIVCVENIAIESPVCVE